jgi:hypothetical protein
MRRDEAIRDLQTELEWLKDGMSHPDTTTALLIHFITQTRDPSLFDMVPEDIKGRVEQILKRFAAEGRSSFYNSKGMFVDDTETIRLLTELLGRKSSGLTPSDQS